MTVWFCSDTHLGHTGILLHQSARLNAFECIEEMDAQLIDNINRVVQPDDLLYHLGDFCWSASKAGHYRQRLKVKQLHIVRGNHDSSSLRQHCSTFQDMLCKKFNGQKIHLCHYPMISWDALHHGGMHLYGHCHGSMEQPLNQWFPGRRAMDVSVDNIFSLLGEWRPISLDEVMERLV
jgi:calcineurin-like phosphoesterase family protein